MFILEKVPAVPYAAPWDLPYQERLNMLRRGSKRVAYFVESANCSTFRYRVYNMVQVLNDQPEEVSASYFFLSDMHHVNDIANCADMLVICRARYDHHIYHLIHAFKRRNKKVLFDVDDLVFNTDYAHLACKTTDYLMGTGQEWDYWFAYMSRMGATLRLCDGGIATNAFLADHMHAFSGLPMNAVPNFLNREQLDISNTIFELRQTISCKQDDNISIGYFSGSPSHVHDFAIALPAIESLLTEMPNLSLALTGYIDANVLRSRFGRSRIHYFQFSDFINLQRLIGSVDFNLVPLQHNAFTQCKSEFSSSRQVKNA